MRQVIGVISDTHGLYRPRIAEVFAGVQLIVHAGDVGSDAVLEQLSRLAPVEAVFGNVDDRFNPRLAAARTVSVGGVTVHVSHGHELPRAGAEAVLNRYPGEVVVFGHTHRAVVHRDRSGRLALNPGAAGPRRFDVVPSVALLTIHNGRADAEIVTL
jgi:hypothetical protein